MRLTLRPIRAAEGVIRSRALLPVALCLFVATMPTAGFGAAQGIEAAKAAAEASAGAREEASRLALRRWQEQRRRAAAHARMPSTMYASTPDPAIPAHPFHAPAVPPSAPRIVPKRSAVEAFPAASAAEGAAEPQTIWLFLGASETSGREGFLRVVNHSNLPGTVRIEATDDAGNVAGPVDLEIGALQAIHLNSRDLEGGNARKGLAEGLGPGQGDWRLTLTSALDVEALSYVRTDDGFVTSMHDTLAERDGALRAGFLNPGSNHRQESRLRLVNPGAEDASVRIAGTDDAGQASGEVTVDLPAGAARTYTAAELEDGAAPGLSGALGDGAGKWRLRIESAQEVVGMSLLATPTGHLTNLSAPPPAADEGGKRTVPLFLSAVEPDKRMGFMRVVNRSDQPATVRIQAFDQSDVEYEPVTLSLEPRQARHFNSQDLENGNPDKGLAGSTGAGDGDWRLELSGDRDFEAMAYVRTKEGFVTSMHDRAPATADGLLHRVAFLNPGSNDRQASRLLLVNPGDADAAAAIDGIDDAGASPGGTVRVRVPAGRTVSLDSEALEGGGDGFEGALGDGKGKWRLWVTSDRPILVASLLDTPTGDLANLSTAPGRGPDRPAGADPEAQAFRTLASPIVQSKCVTCHVAGGVSGDTRLVFVPDTDADHLAVNLMAIRGLLDTVNNASGDGADYILGKIQGVSHGGGVQAAAGTDEFDDMERFLGVLEGDDAEPVTITPGSLFDGVRMESKRSTLRRAAIVFAGRVPTEEEYESIETGGATSLRRAIRGLMTGPGFHEFLIRGSNDRLFTDRRGTIINAHASDYFVDFSNLYHAKAVSKDDDLYQWYERVQFGIRRAPLELFAHVVENDQPYTEILTADYIMANSLAAEAYGASAQFDGADEVHDFRPSEIVSYYRNDETKVSEYSLEFGTKVTDPGDLATDYPHSGVLNTTVFLHRYPTTATNRNRARSRWTYYHFLDLDVEKSASRTTDPVALADTNNPTMQNPACTVCHSVMDPIAGAFQNYGETGLYRDQWGGLDSLDGHYKRALSGTDHKVHASSGATRETADVITASGWLASGAQEIGLTTVNEGEGGSNVHVDYLTIRDESGAKVWHYELEDLADENDDRAWDGMSFEICCEVLIVPVEIPSDGIYSVEVGAWLGYQWGDGEGHPGTLRISMGGPFYRHGDTWYRDMRSPGFGDEIAPNPDNSLPWLAERIAGDPRFADATVKFWWPAIMGDEVAEPPAEGDADFEGRLLASNAQSVEVARLARAFRRGFHGGAAYNLKDLLTEMVLSKWFRADASSGAGPVRTIALASAGAKRLLSPEELARKTVALTGFDWRRRRGENWLSPADRLNWTNTDNQYGLLYGGIDSDGITKRGRDLNQVMAGVAKRLAAATSCPVVMKDLYLADPRDRRLLDGVDLTRTPSSDVGQQAIKTKLVDLHDMLLGVEADVASPDVQTTFDLFIDVWSRHTSDGGDFRSVRCDWAEDNHYFDGVADHLWRTELDEWGNESGWDWDGVNAHFDEIDWSDPHGIARTWVAVLAYLMTDPRYLHL